jgi:hypothetical protein
MQEADSQTAQDFAEVCANTNINFVLESIAIAAPAQ